MTLVPLNEMVLDSSTSDTPYEQTWHLTIPPGLRLFAGHFPGNPVLPGIGQLMMIRKLMERALGCKLSVEQVERARITAPLLPSDVCQMALKWTPQGAQLWRVAIQVQKAETRCSRMVLWLREVAHEMPPPQPTKPL